MPETSLSARLAALQQQHAYRVRQAIDGPQGVEVSQNQQHYLSFCSNDYLGLANDKRVCNATIEAVRRYGVGSGASQLVSGYTAQHAALEEQLADFLGYPRCVLFSSGYLANLGVVASLAEKHCVILQDKLNHASLIDAARAAGAQLKRYRHANTQHAEQLIRSAATQAESHTGLVITDGVFSMEGSIAPLASLAQLASDAQYKFIVDDAHGIGVLGKQGKGSLEHCDVTSSKVDILIGTFGKAFGVSGAFVLSDHETIEYLIQQARTLIYTTAAPACLAAAAQTSLEIIINEPERRQRLHNNIQYFRRCAQHTNLQLLASDTAIQSLVVGENDTALAYCQALKQLGILVIAIRPPTVPKNTARLRITLSSEHSHAQIDQLISALLAVHTNDASP